MKLFDKILDWLEIDRTKFKWWHLIYYPVVYILGALVFGLLYFLLILGVMFLAYM